MINKILGSIFDLSNAPDILYMAYFSDSMADSEKLTAMEDIEKIVSSILEDIKKYKKELEND